MGLFRDRIAAAEDQLTRLDSAIGDGDHGVNMTRGTAAAAEAAFGAGETTFGGLAQTIGMTLISTLGGASGPLYGTFFLRFGAGLGDAEELDAVGVVDAFARGLAGLRTRGKSIAGDKTMIDALTPAVQAMREQTDAGAGLAAVLASGAEAAQAGRDATIPMLARKGRASYLGERSIGHQDPGATSMALLLAAAADAVTRAAKAVAP
jgi:dihydroxyacetone kinase-like protein